MDGQYKQDFIRAGALAKETRSYGLSLIKKGASYNEVIAKINAKILSLNAIAAFPPQIALNDVAAHFLPEPGSDIIFSDEIAKLDIGVCYNGAIGDCAVTIDLSGKHQVLIDAAESALFHAEKSIEVGRPVREIGKIIEDTIAGFGLTSIKNLCGHGLGVYKVHTLPQIPNYAMDSTTFIKPGMTFAIEPFATNGKGLIYEGGSPTIFSMVSIPKIYNGPAKELLFKIMAFRGLPFCLHDLIDEEFFLAKVKALLHELMQNGIIAAYGPLIEEERGMVAQAENSVLVDEKGKVIITTR